MIFKRNKRLFLILIFMIMILFTGCNSEVKQENKIVEKSNINLNSTNISLYKNDEYKIDTTGYLNLIFKSLDSSIAEVSSDGVITAKGVGSTNIIIEGENYNDAIINVDVESKVEDIKFDSDKIVIEKNGTKKIGYSIYPNDSTIKSSSWNISNNIVEIKDDTIKALKPGDSKISLKINDEVEKTFDVKVIVKPEKIEFKENNVTIEVGKTKKINAILKPIDVTEKDIKYEVNDKDIAKIDKNGTITALKVGHTYVTATTSNNLNSKIKIKVEPVVPTSISFNSKYIELYKGKKYKLNAKVMPSNSFNKEVEYSSSNPLVAAVDTNNNVVGFKAGKSIITAKTFNNIKTNLTVYIRNNTYNKNAIFFGDSITYGLGHSWANYISKNYDLKKVVNAGKSGWFISDFMGEKWIVSNVKKYASSNFDYVIMHGGVNDINHDSPLGDIDMNDFSGNYDSKTFIGGLETYIYTVKKQWPNAKIGYIINYYAPLRSSNLKNNSKTYFNAMKKVLNKWNVKYIDLFEGISSSGKLYSDILKVNTYIYMPDGLHINEEGYKLISPDIYNWMNEL